MNKNKPGIVLVLGILVIMVLGIGIAVLRPAGSGKETDVREDEQQAEEGETNPQQAEGGGTNPQQAEGGTNSEQVEGGKTNPQQAEEKETNPQQAEEGETNAQLEEQLADSPFDMSSPVPDEDYTAIVSYQAKKVLESEDGLSKAEITVTMPQLTVRSVAAEKINGQLLDFYKSAFEYGISAGEQDVGFQQESSESAGEDFHYNYTYEEGYQITLLNEQYLSILANGYEYAGGAHGMPFWTSLIFDLETGEQVRGKTLFAVSEEQFGERKLEAYKELFEQDEEGTYWENALSLVEESINFDSDYYLTEKGVTFYYTPYALAPYAAGFVEVTVPYEKLPLIKSKE